MKDKTGVYRVLVRGPDGKSPLGRPTCIWDDTIKMDHEDEG